MKNIIIRKESKEDYKKNGIHGNEGFLEPSWLFQNIEKKLIKVENRNYRIFVNVIN